MLPALPNISRAKLPAVYQRAKTELAACVRIDECKTWSDKAAAMASYAKQADDKTLLNLCYRVKARAIRRCGELLRAIAPSHGGRPNGKLVSAPIQVSRSQTAKHAGLSKRQKDTALQVANVPLDAFEEAVESANPPTVPELAKRGTTAQKPRFDIGDRNPADVQIATHGQGALNGFVDRTNLLPTEQVARGSLPYEYATILSQATKAIGWIHALEHSIHAEQHRRST